MEIIYTKKMLQDALQSAHQSHKTVGLVPTMGALHNGHLTLIKQARAENDIVVCSIFVNPIQFNNQEDLEKYPRLPEEDIELIKDYCDYCFMPSVEEMYPVPPTEKYNFGALEAVMEGAMRPGHFNGVGIVVNRLFQLTQPTFGADDKGHRWVVALDEAGEIQRLIQDKEAAREGVARPLEDLLLSAELCQ